MWNTIKTVLAKALLTKDACGWIIKTALNAALSKASNPTKREKTCVTLSQGGDLMKAAADACKDGTVTDEESLMLEEKGLVFGESIYDLIRG